MTPQEFTDARKALGFNQTQLAKEWGVSDRTIRRYEAGDAPISPIVRYVLNMMLEVKRPHRVRLSEAEVEAIISGAFHDE